MTQVQLVEQPRPHEKVGILLGVGIFLLPFVFAWALLKKGYSTLARGIAFGWLAIFAISAINNYANPGRSVSAAAAPVETKAEAVSPKAEAAAEPGAKLLEEKAGWRYERTKDEMRGTESRHALIISDNKIDMDFPYKPGAAALMLRQRPEDGLSIMLTVDGQFMCSSYSDDTVAVKFDDGPIEQYGCNTSSDSTTGLLFIENEKRFVQKLKAAKKLIIEAEFFQQGPRQMTFSPAGLDW